MLKKTYTWPDDVLAALEAIDQGTVIHAVPCVYTANGKVGITAEAREVTPEGEGAVILDEISVIVLSQTCDIRGGPARRNPLLAVAPVYPVKLIDLGLARNPGSIANAKYLCRLTGPGLQDDVYVADLRFEFTIEKSMVVGRRVEPGFADIDSAYTFAKVLGEHRRRGAFSRGLEDLLQSLGKFLQENALDDQFYEVRVFPQPSAARADRASILCISNSLSKQQIVEITEILSSWVQIAEQLKFIELTGFDVRDICEVTLAEVVDSLPFYYRELSEDPPAP